MEFLFTKSACKISQNIGVIFISPNDDVLRFFSWLVYLVSINKPNVNFFLFRLDLRIHGCEIMQKHLVTYWYMCRQFLH
jgi:hypothetical protein